MRDEDKQALLNNIATIPYKIEIVGTDIVLTERDIISSDYEDFRYVDSDSICIGQFVARVLKGEISTYRTSFTLDNKDIKVSFGVKIGNAEPTWYSLGNFLITKAELDDVNDKVSFEAMDYTKIFNKEFTTTNVTFPCTALELAQAVCEQCNVTLGTTDFTNNDFVIDNNQYTEGDSCRKVMQDIGKLAYSWVRIGWDNKCYIDYAVDNTTPDEYNTIRNNKYYNLSLQKEKFGPVNRVVIGMKDVEGENVVLEDTESIKENGVWEIKIYDNNLTYTPELRKKVIAGANRLFGLTYTPVDMTTVGRPWLLGKERIAAVDMNGNTVLTYAFDRTIAYNGHIKTKLQSKASSRTETTYPNTGSYENDIKKTRIIVDKQNGTISEITSNMQVLDTTVNNNYQEIQNKFDGYTPIEKTVELETSVVRLQTDTYTKTQIDTKLTDGSVTKVLSTSGTFDADGLTIEQTNAKTKGNFNASGLKIIDNTSSIGETLLFAGYDEGRKETVVETANINVSHYLVIGTNSRLEDYEDGTGVFDI